MQKNSVRKTLIDIWSQINKKRKFQLFCLLILMFFSSITEMFTLAASVPFLSIITNPQKLYEQKIFNLFITKLGSSSEQQLIIYITLIFAFLAISTNSIRLLNLWLNTRMAALIGSDLSCKLFNSTLKQDYEFHISNNSSRTITLNTRFISDVVGIINQFLQLILATLIVIGIIIPTKQANPKLTNIANDIAKARLTLSNQ